MLENLSNWREHARFEQCISLMSISTSRTLIRQDLIQKTSILKEETGAADKDQVWIMYFRFDAKKVKERIGIYGESTQLHIMSGQHRQS